MRDVYRCDECGTYTDSPFRECGYALCPDCFGVGNFLTEEVNNGQFFDFSS